MKRVICIFYIFIMTCINQARAKDINVHISGNVIIPPCVINKGENAVIHFDTITEDYNNSSPEIRRAIFNVDCGYYTGTPYLSLRGPTLKGAPRDMLELTGYSSNVTVLGVDLYQGAAASEEMRLIINGGDNSNEVSKLSMSGINKPEGGLIITAVLYRLANKKIITGSYYGSAVMTFSYL